MYKNWTDDRATSRNKTKYSVGDGSLKDADKKGKNWIGREVYCFYLVSFLEKERWEGINNFGENPFTKMTILQQSSI
jgi:hypothetical protein